MRTLHGKIKNLAMATGIKKYLQSPKFAAENKRTYIRKIFMPLGMHLDGKFAVIYP